MIHVQFIRFVVVGLVSNLSLYLLYLFVTYMGVHYAVAATALYVLGVTINFIANKNWSFQHDGPSPFAFRRYLITYAVVYLLNMVLLTMLVEQAGIPHQIAQGGLILFLAFLTFVAQKYWVFENAARS